MTVLRFYNIAFRISIYSFYIVNGLTAFMAEGLFFSLVFVAPEKRSCDLIMLLITIMIFAVSFIFY